MQDELMRLRHENQTLRVENEALREETYGRMMPEKPVDIEAKPKHYLTTGQDALKSSKGKRVSKDKSDE